MANFLQGLPSYNENNFTRFHVDASSKNCSSKKPSVYISTKDHPSQQVITTEKTNILLRFLHQQWGKKQSQTINKRDSVTANLEDDLVPASKMPRLDEPDEEPNST